jgi:hypothetical protein
MHTDRVHAVPAEGLTLMKYPVGPRTKTLHSLTQVPVEAVF